MVRRPDSIPDARRAMREALDILNHQGIERPDGTRVFSTPCRDRPIPYEVRQSVADAAAACGRGTNTPCPVIDTCQQFGFTESVYADDVVYGGYLWRRGVPVVSETRRPKAKISNGRQSIYA